MLFGAIFYLAISLGANLTNRDGDLGRHIRLGRSVLDSLRFPLTDIYSHTMAGGQMIPHEWLAQTALAAMERWFGFDGIAIVVALLIALPWLIMYRWLLGRGTPVTIAAGLVLLGTAASMIHWAARPHAFTWLFVVAWVLLLDDLRNGSRTHVWWLLPLALIWANTHGAFIVGFILVGTHLLGAGLESLRSGSSPPRDIRVRHLSMILLGTFVVSLLNPTGFETIANGFSYVGEDFLVDFTREYGSPDFHNPLFWPFLGMIVLTILTPLRRDATSLLLTISWTAFALHSFRNIPLYALVMTPILANAIAKAWPLFEMSKRSLRDRLGSYSALEKKTTGGLLAVLLIAVVAYSMATNKGSAFGFSRETFPVDAVEAVVENPPGEKVFNMFTWGGFLEFCCHPNIPVFIDGQTDYYGSELTEEYDETINGGPTWRATFETHSIDWVMITPESALAQILSEAEDWTEFYRDATAVIFVPASVDLGFNSPTPL